MTGRAGPLGGSPGILLPPQTPVFLQWEDNRLSAGNASNYSVSTFVNPPNLGRRVIIAAFCGGFQTGLIDGSSCTVGGRPAALITQRDRLGASSSRASVALFQLIEDATATNPTTVAFSLTAAQDAIGLMAFDASFADLGVTMTRFDDDGVTPWSGSNWPTRGTVVLPQGGAMLAASVACADSAAALTDFVGPWNPLNSSQIYDGTHNVKMGADYYTAGGESGERTFGYSIQNGASNLAAASVFAVWR